MNLDNLLILLQEVDCYSQEEKQSLEKHLRKLIENIFKLQYWELEKGRDYKRWGILISKSRDSIARLIEANPSLRRHMEKIYPELYQNAISVFQTEFYIPDNTPIKLEQILKQNYFG